MIKGEITSAQKSYFSAMPYTKISIQDKNSKYNQTIHITATVKTQNKQYNSNSTDNFKIMIDNFYSCDY